MRRPLLAMVLIFLAGAANALSCLPPDALRLYRQAAESEDLYVIVRGRLAPTPEIAVPEVSPDGSGPQDQMTSTRVRMTGVALGSERFDQAFDRRIDVEVRCLSIWCGAPVTDRDILAALRLSDDVPVLEIGPCGGMAMPLEDADMDSLLECHRNARCEGK